MATAQRAGVAPLPDGHGLAAGQAPGLPCDLVDRDPGAIDAFHDSRPAHWWCDLPALARRLPSAPGGVPVSRREGRLELAWQPLLRCADGELEHREAFARLDDGAGGMLPAGAFIALAEEEGLAAGLDRRVAARAWAVLAAAPSVSGALNLSPASLTQPDFVDWLANLVAQPRRLYLECGLARVAASPAVADALVELRRRGFGLTLDRFVPGTTGLELMATLRPDWVKLDSGICRHALDHAGARVLLRGLVEYARELGVRVAATGVERRADLALLRDLGLDAAQGRACDAAGPV